MTQHIVAKRSTKEQADKEMKRAQKAVPTAKYVVKKYKSGFAVYTIGNFGVDTAAKAKEREQAKAEKIKLEKKLAAEEAKAEALRKKLRAMGQHTLAEAGVKTFKHW